MFARPKPSVQWRPWEILLLLPAVNVGVMNGAHGATYYVDANARGRGSGTLGEPFSTIQQAAGLLKPGDVCVLREGVYRETVTPAQSGTDKALSPLKTTRTGGIIMIAKRAGNTTCSARRRRSTRKTSGTTTKRPNGSTPGCPVAEIPASGSR